MALHALIETVALVERPDLGQRTDFSGPPPDLSHKASPAIKWVPVVTATDPTPPNPATEKWQVNADVITLTEVTASRSVVPLTAQEIIDRDAALHALVTEEIDRSGFVADGQVGVRTRALIGNPNQRINWLTNRVIQLQNVVAAMLASTGAVANLRTDGIAAAAVAFPQARTAEADTHFASTAIRPKPNAIQDFKDDVESGAQNT